MNFLFKLKQKVEIFDLGIDGRVISIWITETGIQYRVRYFWNDDIKEVYFYEEELKDV